MPPPPGVFATPISLHLYTPPPPVHPPAPAALHPLLADGPFGLLRLDDHLRIRYVNPALCRLLGFGELELRGRSLPDLLGGRDLCASGLAQAVRHTPYHRLEARLFTRTHEEAWVRLTLMAQPEDAEGPAGFVALVEDLRDTKEVETALWRMSQRFATLFHGAPLAAALLSVADLTFKDLNRRFLDLAGYERHELVDAFVGARGLFEEADIRTALACVQKDRTRVYEREVLLRDRSGGLRPVLLSLALVHQQASADALLMLTDLTERKAIESSLRDSEERYRTFVETISEAIWRFDFPGGIDCRATPEAQFRALLEHGQLVECNDVFSQHLLGRSDRPLGQRVGDLLPPTPSLQQLYTDFIHSDYRIQNRLFRAGRTGDAGRAFVVNLVGLRQDNRLVGLWGSAVDVSASIQLKQQMATALERQQQRIGHDLQNGVGQLLTGIRLLCEQLGGLATPATPGLAPLVEKVAGMAKEAVGETRRLYRGLVPPQIGVQGLARCLEHLAATLNEVSSTAIRFEAEPGVNVWEPDVALQLYRIAQEASCNALKYGSAAHLTLSLTRDGDTLALRIEDDGIGFDPADRPGGLGLDSMCYRATVVGGALDVQSAPGRGTTITCRLPLHA